MQQKELNFIQSHSPDGGFLQSEVWRRFQVSWGRKTFCVDEKDDSGQAIASASIIEHQLPIVGKYFYAPRGPVVKIRNLKSEIRNLMQKTLKLAKENNIGWIRIEPASDAILEFLRLNLKNIKIRKSAVDMQPREILVLDILKSEEEILAQMKQKTRYNIRLAEKKGVTIKVADQADSSDSKKYIDEFLRLVKITAERDKITVHPESYYRKMFETIPSEILRLYVAEYEGKVIAANLMLFFGGMATYMHGASDNQHRNLMAPYLLQWQAIRDAKESGCKRYDLGGVKIQNEGNSSWAGITKFKTGFAPETMPIQFPGSYDLIIDPWKYKLYRMLQKIKRSI